MILMFDWRCKVWLVNVRCVLFLFKFLMVWRIWVRGRNVLFITIWNLEIFCLMKLGEWRLWILVWVKLWKSVVLVLVLIVVWSLCCKVLECIGICFRSVSKSVRRRRRFRVRLICGCVVLFCFKWFMVSDCLVMICYRSKFCMWVWFEMLRRWNF